MSDILSSAKSNPMVPPASEDSVDVPNLPFRHGETVPAEPPPVQIPSQTVVPPAYQSSRRIGMLTVVVLLFITLPLSVYFVSQRRQLMDQRSSAAFPALPSPTPLARKQTAYTPSYETSRQRVPQAVNYDRYLSQFTKGKGGLASQQTKAWDIVEPSIRVTGILYVTYDASSNKTYIFSRLQGLPPPSERIVHLWMTTKNETVNLGSVGVVPEPGGLTGYAAVDIAGDKRVFEKLTFSYDTSPAVKKPDTPIITIR